MIESNADETLNLDALAEAQEEKEIEIDTPNLRPQSLEDFIGQGDLKKGLSIFIEAAQKREEPLDHMLFYGNPGLGKTTLAHIIANEMSADIRITSGPALERVGDLAAILSNLKRGDILFIDEIHRMNRSIEEVLYPAMEDFALDLVVGKGPSARTLRLSLEQFTVIGATTRLSLLSSPLRDRFGYIGHLEFYSSDDMVKIIQRSGRLLDMEVDDATAEVIAARARSTPRIANRLLKRARDFAEVRRGGNLSPDIATEALDLLAIDHSGLNSVDRRILEHIIHECEGGPVGIAAVAAALQQELSTIEEVHEPFLLQIGFLQRTPRGRQATKKAYTHLGIKPARDILGS
jgi:Holliday junction DNA helicase RuvB